MYNTIEDYIYDTIHPLQLSIKEICDVHQAYNRIYALEKLSQLNKKYDLKLDNRTPQEVLAMVDAICEYEDDNWEERAYDAIRPFL